MPCRDHINTDVLLPQLWGIWQTLITSTLIWYPWAICPHQQTAFWNSILQRLFHSTSSAQQWNNSSALVGSRAGGAFKYCREGRKAWLQKHGKGSNQHIPGKALNTNPWKGWLPATFMSTNTLLFQLMEKVLLIVWSKICIAVACWGWCAWACYMIIVQWYRKDKAAEISCCYRKALGLTISSSRSDLRNFSVSVSAKWGR